jgi:hypothetical protein
MAKVYMTGPSSGPSKQSQQFYTIHSLKMVRKFKTEPSSEEMMLSYPLRTRQKRAEDLIASISPIPGTNSVLCSIQPPAEPEVPLKRASCDIVLVIDISYSMFFEAPLPDSQGSPESAGLSILDLVRHAALTILETLSEGDRLALVTFAGSAKVGITIYHLTPLIPSRLCMI